MNALLKNTNTDLILIFDDVPGLDKIKNFDWTRLNWAKRDSLLAGDTCRITFNPRHYCLRFAEDLVSAAIDQLSAYDKNVKLIEINTFFSILSTPGNNGQKLHSDTTFPGTWSILYYLDGIDGPTEFSDADGNIVHSVEFKPGRLVVFPSIYSHRGCLPSKGKRTILNAIVRLKFNLNKQVYSASA